MHRHLTLHHFIPISRLMEQKIPTEKNSFISNLQRKDGELSSEQQYFSNFIRKLRQMKSNRILLYVPCSNDKNLKEIKHKTKAVSQIPIRSNRVYTTLIHFPALPFLSIHSTQISSSSKFNAHKNNIWFEKWNKSIEQKKNSAQKVSAFTNNVSTVWNWKWQHFQVSSIAVSTAAPWLRTHHAFTTAQAK